MHEYDINKLKAERTGLPPRTRSNNRQTNIIQKQQTNQTETSTHNKASKTATPTDAKDITIKNSEKGLKRNLKRQAALSDSGSDSDGNLAPPIIYPLVLECVHQSPVKHPSLLVNQLKSANLVVLPKRKRQRHVYEAEYSRCLSLRSHRSNGETASVKQHTALPPAPPTQASPTPAEAKEQKYIKPDQFKPVPWDIIEEVQETKATTSKRRRGFGRSSKKQRKSPIALDTIYSPETAAAIAAAQLELDSGKPAARASRKRSHAMSLYDRRYQTTSEDRRVGNGYGSSGLRLATVGATSSDADAQDIQTHQYYGPAGGNNSAGSGLNGSISTLNHAPAMGTLCNIGNTCYLNSVVYTLRFAPHFLHNLHHLIYDLDVVQQTILRQNNTKSASLGRGVSGAHLEHARSWSSKDLATTEQYISSSNGSGAVNCSNNGSNKPSHQSVTEKLHDLYHSLHGNEMADSTEAYHADTLLHAIQDVNATFEGNQQQDAHEFLMCVLNCIRETNQSLIKGVSECPEVIANGYIANPDETDSSDAHDRTDAAATSLGSHASSGGNGSVPASHTTKTSFFSRKSKRKDEVKSSKATRLQSPLKDNINPIAATIAPAHSTSNSLFYLNTVDLSGANAMTQTAVGTATAATAAGTGLPAKYSSDDEMNTAGLLKDKMRLEDRIRELNLNFFSTDFEGIVVLTTKCLSCETVTRQKQGMLDISVPVPISGYDNADLTDNPSAFIQNSCITREYFRGENKYSCNQCTGYTEAIRSISYEVLPRLLVVQLNRFSGGMEKVSTYVPTTFTLPCFCVKCCELSDANKLHVYKLYSVITHVGATLTVGHYIAYTSFLDLASDYVNCPKDRRSMSTQQQQQQQQQQPGNENAAPNNGSSSSSTPVSAAASALASSGTSLIKKMKFGRSKASSSGDMSKNMKPLNGITSKAITNGIGKLSMNTTCHGVNCCAMRLCCNSAMQQQQQSNATSSNSASSSDFSEESLQNGTNSSISYGAGTSAYPTGYGSTGRGGVKINYSQSSTEPIWYMCDDDKIKAMTQREFEELLSPTRKITITPYLLFYARFDMQPAAAQPTPPKPGTSSTPPPPMPQSSWSNESLQSGLHKMQ